MITGVSGGSPGYREWPGRQLAKRPVTAPRATAATAPVTLHVTMHVTVPRVDNLLPDVGPRAAAGFFRAHPVDDISAGRGRGVEPHDVAVPSCVPRLRTASAACLHRLSTGLCTARLDGAG